MRDTEAAGDWAEGLPLRRVLVLVYGFADSRAAEVGAARVERRAGGMARAVVGCVVECCWCRLLLVRPVDDLT